jgi:uncharacterized protein
MRSASRQAWKRALITGSSGGIGAGFGRTLAASGTALVLVARRRARLEALAENLERVHHVEVEVMAADLLDRDDLARVEARLGTSPEIDLLVNNAGSETEHGLFCQRGIDLLTAEVELNFLTPLRLTHAACQAMPAHGGGNVINVSAGNAFYPTPGAAAYGASKAAINSLTEALAFELRGSGVTVIAFCPGFTRTDAQSRLGLKVDPVPGFLWSEPEQVATAALRAASRRKVVDSINTIERLNAFFGRHLPRRVLLPLIAQANRRLTISAGG